MLVALRTELAQLAAERLESLGIEGVVHGRERVYMTLPAAHVLDACLYLRERGVQALPDELEVVR